MMAAVLPAMIAGCTADSWQEAPADAALVPISVSVAGNSTTRAGMEVQESQFLQNETVYVHFAEGTAVNSNSQAISNLLYRTTDNNGTTAITDGGQQPFVSPEVDAITVHAYYPHTDSYTQQYSDYQLMTETSDAFAVQEDQSDDEFYKFSDLMFATATVQRQGKSVMIPLQFRHLMAKVTIMAIAMENVTKINDIRLISGYRGIDITDPLNGTLGTALFDKNTAEASLKVWEKSGGADTVFCSALLPPQTIDGDFIRFSTDNGDYTYKVSQKTLESGKEHVFVLRVGATAPIDDSRTIVVSPIADQVYTGSAITPAVEVKNAQNETLTAGTDYRVVTTNAVNVGTATAIIIGLGERYAGSVEKVTFNIVKAAGTISFAKAADEIAYWENRTYNGDGTDNPLTKVGDGTVTYSSGDTSIATVDASTGRVTLLKDGTVTITATVADGQNYHYATPTASYTLTVKPRTPIDPNSNIDDWVDDGNNNPNVEF